MKTTNSSGASDVAASGNAKSPSIETLLATLTERERQIVQLVCDGCPDKEIERRLDLSEGTVKVHVHDIYKKLASALGASPARRRTPGSNRLEGWIERKVGAAVLLPERPGRAD